MFDMRRLDLRSTAFHEAGHAVVALLKGIRFSKVWIRLRRDSDQVPQDVELGQLTRVAPINKPDFAGKLEEAKVEAVQAFAGPMAECHAYPDMKPDLRYNPDDVSLAQGVLRFATLPFTVSNGVADFNQADIRRTAPQMQQMLNECCQIAERLVNENRTQVEKVALALLDRFELTEDEVRELCLYRR